MDDFLFGPLKKLPGGSGLRYERDAAQGKAATVRNPSGKPRTFQENMAFLTLCCVRYAMVNYCDAGGGYGWGNIKPTKCETDPDRIDVKRTYLRDYSRALKMEEQGTHILVYFDESYIHQNHAAGKSWLKRTVDGMYIGRNRSKGKRLIILHGESNACRPGSDLS